MDRKEKAAANHKAGYNCAQSLVCAYCDLLGVDEKTAFRMSEGFGLGMGSMGTCGAVTAMAILVGMKESDGNLDKPATKKMSYKKISEMTEAFEAKNGSIICRELKGVSTGVVLRSCSGCIEDAADIIEEQLL